jgi:hypothetical protein
MKKIFWRYGAYAGIAEFVCFVLTWLVIDITKMEHRTQGSIGYVAIITPMIFVYFGIRHYRNQFNNGAISFLKAVQVGMLIIIIPTISFAIIETVYVLYIQPEFYENIAGYEIADLRSKLPPAEFAAKAKEIREHIELYKNPYYNFAGMILTIGALGTIATLISSLLLMRKTKRGVV